MTLDEFRRSKNLTFDALAQKLGIEGSNRARTAQRYCTHERIPPWPMMRRIEEATEKEVTCYDFPDSSHSPSQPEAAA